MSVKAREQSICRKTTGFPKQSRAFKKKLEAQLSEKGFQTSAQRRLGFNLLILVLKFGKNISVTIGSGPQLYLAKALHFQFQTAIIKFALSNLVCLRYVRKYKHLHSPKSSCGLAVPGWDLKLTGSFPLTGNRPAVLCGLL